MGVSSIPRSSSETVYIGSARINKNWHHQDKITQSAGTSHFGQSMVIWRWPDGIWLKHSSWKEVQLSQQCGVHKIV